MKQYGLQYGPWDAIIHCHANHVHLAETHCTLADKIEKTNELPNYQALLAPPRYSTAQYIPNCVGQADSTTNPYLHEYAAPFSTSRADLARLAMSRTLYVITAPLQMRQRKFAKANGGFFFFFFFKLFLRVKSGLRVGCFPVWGILHPPHYKRSQRTRP